MTDSIETIMAECFKATNALDFDRALCFYADEAVHTDFAVNLSMEGKSEIEVFWKAWLPALNNEEWSLQPHNMRFVDDCCTAEWIWRGRFDQEFMGLKPGRRFAVPGASVVMVQDGKIARWNDYYSISTMLAQVGVAEIPAQILGLVPAV